MEFIQEYLIDSLIYIQLIPVIFGLLVWKRLDYEYKLFVLLLLYSVLNEMFKIYYGKYIDFDHNMMLTNVYNIVYFLFLFWLFYRKTNTKLLKNTILFFTVLYLVATLYEITIDKINYHTQTQVKPYIIGGFGVLTCVFFYFSSILNSKKVVNVYLDMLFWIAIAHFIYYLGFVPFKIGENYFVAFEKYHYLFNIKIPVTTIKCIILSIGFILCKRQRVQ